MSEYEERKPPVLLIEDDEATSEAIVAGLKSFGYENVSACSSGAEAIKELNNNPRRYPIAIIDIFLDDMTAKHMASNFPKEHAIQKLLIISVGTADDFAAVRSVFERQGILEVRMAKKPINRETLKRFLS